MIRFGTQPTRILGFTACLTVSLITPSPQNHPSINSLTSYHIGLTSDTALIDTSMSGDSKKFMDAISSQESSKYDNTNILYEDFHSTGIFTHSQESFPAIHLLTSIPNERHVDPLIPSQTAFVLEHRHGLPLPKEMNIASVTTAMLNNEEHADITPTALSEISNHNIVDIPTHNVISSPSVALQEDTAQTLFDTDKYMTVYDRDSQSKITSTLIASSDIEDRSDLRPEFFTSHTEGMSAELAAEQISHLPWYDAIFHVFSEISEFIVDLNRGIFDCIVGEFDDLFHDSVRPVIDLFEMHDSSQNMDTIFTNSGENLQAHSIIANQVATLMSQPDLFTKDHIMLVHNYGFLLDDEPSHMTFNNYSDTTDPYMKDHNFAILSLGEAGNQDSSVSHDLADIAIFNGQDLILD